MQEGSQSMKVFPQEGTDIPADAWKRGGSHLGKKRDRKCDGLQGRDRPPHSWAASP